MDTSFEFQFASLIRLFLCVQRREVDKLERGIDVTNIEDETGSSS